MTVSAYSSLQLIRLSLNYSFLINWVPLGTRIYMYILSSIFQWLSPKKNHLFATRPQLKIVFKTIIRKHLLIHYRVLRWKKNIKTIIITSCTPLWVCFIVLHNNIDNRGYKYCLPLHMRIYLQRWYIITLLNYGRHKAFSDDMFINLSFVILLYVMQYKRARTYTHVLGTY